MNTLEFGSPCWSPSRPEATVRQRSVVALLVLMMGASTVALARSSGGKFEVSTSTVDGGGGLSAGGDFTLLGTIGQADAAEVASTGGSFQLTGGFWASASDLIFRNGYE